MDTSKLGVAEILLQYHDQDLKSVVYFSRTTNDHKLNYHSYERLNVLVFNGNTF